MASERRTVFPCNTCFLTFTTSALQRAHMQQPWHVYNVKLKVSGLPAMIEREYEAQERKSEEATQRPRINDATLVRKPRIKSHNVDSAIGTNSEMERGGIFDDGSGEVPSTRCLFCQFLTSTHMTILEHMSVHHGLFIPSPSALYSLDSLLSYLAELVFDYHECLYCGQEKGTVDAVQTHMRDKGHCMINMSDLVDFWDLEADEGCGDDRTDAAITELTKTEKRLPSGLTIRPRQAHPRRRASQQRLSKKTAAITQGEHHDQETLANTPSRQLALHNNYNDRHLTTIPRTAQGLTGLSDQQLRTLQMVDKRMKSREESAKAKARYAAQQQPVKTVYYKTENPVYQTG